MKGTTRLASRGVAIGILACITMGVGTAAMLARATPPVPVVDEPASALAVELDWPASGHWVDPGVRNDDEPVIEEGDPSRFMSNPEVAVEPVIDS